MTITSLRQVRRHLKRHVRAVQTEPTIITNRGEPVAVLVSMDDWEELAYDAELLRPEAQAELRESAEAIARGATTSLEDVKRELAARGRR